MICHVLIIDHSGNSREAATAERLPRRATCTSEAASDMSTCHLERRPIVGCDGPPRAPNVPRPVEQPRVPTGHVDARTLTQLRRKMPDVAGRRRSVVAGVRHHVVRDETRLQNLDTHAGLVRRLGCACDAAGGEYDSRRQTHCEHGLDEAPGRDSRSCPARAVSRGSAGPGREQVGSLGRGRHPDQRKVLRRPREVLQAWRNDATHPKQFRTAYSERWVITGHGR
jgi:hypothetical protein